MKQTGFIQSVIEAVQLDDGMVKGGFTPSEQRPLIKDSYGEPTSGMFSYSSIVGMLLYISGHTLPDIYFSVNFCDQCMFIPKIYH